ncbi:hypothetical protein HPB51_004454 [Rhipicephalus microplus]|uniref:Uncharacterized protein n=1 Tax=Rhipicephalus microplus TaxID=6941 RepID=A0A9J6EM71_RHIMP|nr:hypothetical protein HPB51_004454 [Rhipicephalus microplus]
MQLVPFHQQTGHLLGRWSEVRRRGFYSASVLSPNHLRPIATAAKLPEGTPLLPQSTKLPGCLAATLRSRWRSSRPPSPSVRIVSESSRPPSSSVCIVAKCVLRQSPDDVCIVTEERPPSPGVCTVTKTRRCTSSARVEFIDTPKSSSSSSAIIQEHMMQACFPPVALAG